MKSIYVSFAHILFTGPLLLYVGVKRPTDIWIYYFMAIYGLIAAIYLLYKLFGSEWKPDKIWYIVHILLFIPLVLYISIYNKKMNPTFFSFLTAVGIAAIGYHLFKLLR